MTVAPGARESLRIAIVHDVRGERRGAADLREAARRSARAARDATLLRARLADARLLTPSPEISRGVVWAKANMLRIIKEYPQGWGSTNSPPSDILVSRDTSWFVHGFDYFLPQFSRDAIEVFNRFIEPSGQVVEYVRGVSGYSTSYDLNVNDDTPLHLIAILHHYNATLDDAWVKGILPSIVRVADYLLSQRDAQRADLLQRQGRRHVRHHLVAQHHPVLHARRRGDRDQRRRRLRARSRGHAVRGRRRQRALGDVLAAKRRRCARR